MSTQDPNAIFHALEQEFLALKQAYDRFFLRLERTPPDAARTALRRKLQQAHAEHTTQTRLGFQHRSLEASLLTYENLWDRKVLQQEQAQPQAAGAQQVKVATVPAQAPVHTDADPIVRAHAALVDQYLRLGLAGAPKIEEVRAHLAEQLKQARDKAGTTVPLGLKIITQQGLPTLVVVPKV